jgi:hypothetical protein
MSFTRQKYDAQCQVEAYQNSLYSGKYSLETPLSCQPCYEENPQIRLQRNGGSVSRNERNLKFRGPIDVESELFNLNQVASKCKFKPNRRFANENNLFNGTKKCFFPVDNTRLTNPASNLSGVERIRLDYPLTDPQANIFFPGRTQVDTRLELKDNWRPCIEFPQTDKDFVRAYPEKGEFKTLNV